MSLELPAPLRIAITQAAAVPRALEAFDHIAVLLPESAKHGAWPAFPHSKLLESRQRARGGDRLLTELEDGRGTRVSVAFVAPSASTFELLTLARKLIDEARVTQPQKLALFALGFEAALASRAAEAYASALLAAEAQLPDFKKSTKPKRAVASLSIHGPSTAFDLERCRATAEANNLARWLTTLPPNLLHPTSYRALLAKLAKRHGWTLKFHDEKALAKRGAEAFLAVVRGSAERDAGIAELSYAPKKVKNGAKALALVGKGLCYDTGGSNLKTAKGMNGMQGDMGGSAVALSALVALSTLGAPFPVRCYLAIAENRIGPKAYIPNEVLRASNGVTIETVHTDAEGRMVLADTLVLASEAKPAGIIDFATLTGSAVHALTDRMGAVFTNRAALNPTLIAAGDASGERVWPFPMHADYDEALESKLADIKQCLIEGQGDHILAARFLSKFVGEDIPWVHLDMCPGDREGGLAHIPSFFTGFGLRFALDLVLDRGFAREASPSKVSR